MLITGMSFSAIMTGLGIVALAGIVVKNGIVLIDTYNHYNRDDGVEPVKAMLITISQRVRPVLLTATVTALGVIPMALNVEFDFIRREIVVGGLAGTWFVALSRRAGFGPVRLDRADAGHGAGDDRRADRRSEHQFGRVLPSGCGTLPGRLIHGNAERSAVGRRTAVTPEGDDRRGA